MVPFMLFLIGLMLGSIAETLKDINKTLKQKGPTP